MSSIPKSRTSRRALHRQIRRECIIENFIFAACFMAIGFSIGIIVTLNAIGFTG